MSLDTLRDLRDSLNDVLDEERPGDHSPVPGMVFIGIAWIIGAILVWDKEDNAGNFILLGFGIWTLIFALIVGRHGDTIARVILVLIGMLPTFLVLSLLFWPDWIPSLTDWIRTILNRF